MKINGITLTEPAPKILVIPRGNGQIVFTAKAILSFADFNKMVPVPLPEVRDYSPDPRGKVTMYDAPEYDVRLRAYAKMKTNWTVIQSLKATEALTWDTVKDDDPATWHLFEKELEEAGFSELHINAICGIAIDACGLSQHSIDEATQSFLALQPEA